MAVARKTVTVLFADVADSTGLAERLDPESVRGALTRWFELAREVIERHGGLVEKFIGDAVMAVFGVPQLHEDDAVRAVRAAEELHLTLKQLNVELERERGLRLAIRVGVNSGEVVTGDGDGMLVTGDAVNVAKRFEEAAEAGEVLVGEMTVRLAGSAATFEPLQPIAAKGKSAALPVWRLLSVTDAPPFERRFDTPFVGRARELEHLSRAYERATQERTCYLFTLLGPAGIGKSRLATELFARLGDEPTVLVGRCLPYGDGITFWPLSEVLQAVGGDEAIVELLAGTDDAQIVVERLRGVTGRASVDSQETFWAVRKVCEALARRRPLVLCFEDVHWAEPTFLDLIEYLAGWIRDVPILLLCLARPEFLDERPSWLSGQETAASLTLSPLTASESDQLLDALGASGEIRGRISEAAEGNPLFAEQMAAVVAETGYAQGFLEIPSTIQALLAARLDRLTSEERSVIERAAVCGKEFWRDAVIDLTPQADRDHVGSTLMSLVRKELIRPYQSAARPDDAFRFGHVLIRDAAYLAVPKLTRTKLHEQFADWLAKSRDGDAPEPEELIGYHLEQSYRLTAELAPVDDHARRLAARAGSLLGSAGRRAFARSDMHAAANLLGRAVRLEAEDRPEKPLLLRELSAALWATGELDRAEAMQAEALAAAVAASDPRLEWYVRLDAAARRSLTDPEGVEHLREVATEAIDVFQELGDELGLARAWRGLALIARGRCRFAEAEEAAERALLHAEASGDPGEIAGIVDLLCTALLYGPAHAEQASARCSEIGERSDSNPLLAANAASSRAGLEAMRGRFDEARMLLARAATIYDELGHRLFRAGLSQVAGSVELMAGRPDVAERELRHGFDILAEAGQTALIGYPALMVAETLLIQGRADEARRYAEIGQAAVSPDDITDQVVARIVAARLEASAGDRADGEAEARRAVALAERTDSLALHADALALVGELLVLDDRPVEARATLEEAVELYDRKGHEVGSRRAAALAKLAAAAPAG